MATCFEIKKKYNFNMNTNLVSILGDRYTIMKVKGILTSDQAIRYTDITTMHQQVKPLLTSLPENTSDLTYILFETIDGEEVVYANEYIDSDSIVETDKVNIRVDVANASTEDMNNIKTMLAEAGYSNISVSTFE